MTDDTVFSTEVGSDYPDYLRDESRRVGTAASISFPGTEQEIRRHLAESVKRGLKVTVQGARTGIAAGAVPEGGHILNLSRMNKMLGLHQDGLTGDFLVGVEPGVLLSELRKHIEDEGEAVFKDTGRSHFFPPDPTETSASIGGMVSCNASGARSFFYGSTRKYVEALRVILADGSALDLRRGEQRAVGRKFSVKTDSGRVIEGSIPSYSMPNVKNASGYYVADDMDLVDLFIGAEGTLGIVSAMELRLARAPKSMWGVMAFFAAEDAAVKFVRSIRDTAPRPVAVEFFDHGALDLLRRQKKTNPAFGEIPEMPLAWHTAVYIEYHGDTEEQLESAVTAMSEIMVACGGDADATWLSSDEREIERLKGFRHAVPEAVNLMIDERRKKEPKLTKLGTDLAVPDRSLEDVIALYHDGLKRTGLEYVMFGHIGNNHLHVNILPNSLEEYDKGKKLYLEWAHAVVAMGGSVSAEHGIGKMKNALLKEMFGEKGIAEMQELKRLFDPDGTLNPGNLFEPARRQ